MRSNFFLMLISTLIIQSCTTPDHRLGDSHDSMSTNRDSFNQEIILEASASQTPEWVASFLENWDCGENYCATGRIDIRAHDISYEQCLEESDLKAIKILASAIQNELSNKIMLGSDESIASQRQIRAILTDGFALNNLYKIVIGGNYYKLILKQDDDASIRMYQCYSLAKISKMRLRNLIAREAIDILGPETAEIFQNQLDREWNGFFKSGPYTKLPFKAIKNRDPKSSSAISSVKPYDLDSIRKKVIGVSITFLNVPYQFGGDLSDGTVDCSGYVKAVYGVFGIILPRTSLDQFSFNGAENVNEELLPGDLVFFSGTLRPSYQPSHVGIYLGNNKFINANGNYNARRVQIDDISSPYWHSKYLGARRIITRDNFPTDTVASSGF